MTIHPDRSCHACAVLVTIIGSPFYWGGSNPEGFYQPFMPDARNPTSHTEGRQDGTNDGGGCLAFDDAEHRQSDRGAGGKSEHRVDQETASWISEVALLPIKPDHADCRYSAEVRTA